MIQIKNLIKIVFFLLIILAPFNKNLLGVQQLDPLQLEKLESVLKTKKQGVETIRQRFTKEGYTEEALITLHNQNLFTPIEYNYIWNDDRFPFWALPDELQDNIWEWVGTEAHPSEKNLVVKNYCRKALDQGENFYDVKAKIIANNLDPMTVKSSVAQDILQLPETAQKEIGKHFADIHNYKLLNQLKIFRKHPQCGNIKGITLNNKEIFAWSDGMIQQWNTDNPEEVLNVFQNSTANNPFQKVILDNDGHLFSLTNRGIQVWDIKRKKCLMFLVAIKERSEEREDSTLCFSKQMVLDKKGRLFAEFREFHDEVSCTNLIIWNSKNGENLGEILDPHPIGDFLIDDLNDRLVYRTIATPKANSQVKEREYFKYICIYKISNRECLFTSPDQECSIYDIVHDGGDILFLCLGNGKVCVINMETGEYFREFQAHERVVRGGILDDKKRLFTYSNDGTICMWDWMEGKCLRLFRHDREVKGKYLRLFRHDREECLRLLRYDREVKGVRLDNKRGTLISWSTFTICIWEIKSGKCINIFKRGRYIRDIVIDDCGRLFCLVASTDRTLSAYNTPEETLESKMQSYINCEMKIRQEKLDRKNLEKICLYKI